MEIIFDHIIKSEEIIGIGPLYAQPSSDPAMRSLYNSFRYVFDVHCKKRSIEIKSDYFFPKESEDKYKEMQAWKDQYCQVRDRIKELVQSPV